MNTFFCFFLQLVRGESTTPSCSHNRRGGRLRFRLLLLMLQNELYPQCLGVDRKSKKPFLCF